MAGCFVLLMAAASCSQGRANVATDAGIEPASVVELSADERRFFSAMCQYESVVAHDTIEEMAEAAHSVVLGRLDAVRPGRTVGADDGAGGLQLTEVEISVERHVAGDDLGDVVVLEHIGTVDPAAPLPAGRVVVFVVAKGPNEVDPAGTYRVLEPAGLLYEPPGGELAPPHPALVCPGEIERGLYTEVAADIAGRTIADVIDLLAQ